MIKHTTFAFVVQIKDSEEIDNWKVSFKGFKSEFYEKKFKESTREGLENEKKAKLSLLKEFGETYDGGNCYCGVILRVLGNWGFTMVSEGKSSNGATKLFFQKTHE